MSSSSGWTWFGRNRSSLERALVDVSSHEQMPAWPDYYHRLVSNASQPLPPPDRQVLDWLRRTRQRPIPVNNAINRKVKLWQGDITTLKVNAANGGMWAGGGVCGAIHTAAGPQLEKESIGWVKRHGQVEAGETLVTKAYNLPARFVFHTVGPRDGNGEKLQHCYSSCLDLLVEHDCRSIAFCCVSTGIFGFDNREAAVIAMDTVRSWLEREDSRNAVDTVVFCCFLDKDMRIYQRNMPVFFPCGDDPQAEGNEATEQRTAATQPAAAAEVTAETKPEAAQRARQASNDPVEAGDVQQAAAPAADGGSEADLMQISRGDTVMTRVGRPAEDSRL